MDLILNYLSSRNSEDDEQDDEPRSSLVESSDQAVLKHFFDLFMTTKTRYDGVMSDMKRIEAARKAELAKVSTTWPNRSANGIYFILLYLVVVYFARSVRRLRAQSQEPERRA